MEISSHYYGIYALCIACGIRKEIAEKIAYASQFVDDAVINTITFDKDYKDNLFSVIDGKSKVTNIATCHSYFVIKTLNYQAMIFNTSAFHFFPGNKGNTFTKKMRCMKNPVILQKFIQETIKEKPFIPEKLGMLLHIYADTFSHQGFSGLISKENDINGLKSNQEKGILSAIKLFIKKRRDPLYSLFDKFIPAYGHAQAFHYPDIPYGQWEYSYDKSDDFSNDKEFSGNDNSARFPEAFEAISVFLGNIKGKDIYDSVRLEKKEQNIKSVLNLLVRPMSDRKKIEAWKKLIIKFGIQTVPDYSESLWLKEAFKNYSKDKFSGRVVNKAELRDDYKDSSWYAFIRAMEWYKPEFLKRLKQDGLLILY